MSVYQDWAREGDRVICGAFWYCLQCRRSVYSELDLTGPAGKWAADEGLLCRCSAGYTTDQSRCWPGGVLAKGR